MIAEEKRQIIMDEGSPVNVYDATGLLLYQTSALVGRATKQYMSDVSLESYRSGQFLPELAIENGLLVERLLTGETFLTIAGLPEVIGNEKTAYVSRMVVCNTEVKVESLEETADDNGNVFTAPVVKTQVKGYVQPVTSELIQYKPGLYENAEYLLYVPYIELKNLDKVVLQINGRDESFKVETFDDVSFPGVAVVSICSETRM